MNRYTRISTANNNRYSIRIFDKNIAYISGGIGYYIASISGMTFGLTGSGEYVADVKFVIEKSKGRNNLEADSPGPIIYVNHHDGKLSNHDKTLRKSIAKMVTSINCKPRNKINHIKNVFMTENDNGENMDHVSEFS